MSENSLLSTCDGTVSYSHSDTMDEVFANTAFGHKMIGLILTGTGMCVIITRGQSNLTKRASPGAHSPVRGHPRGSKFVPLNSWGRGSY